MSSAVFCVTSSDLVVTSRLFCKVSSSDTCNIEMYVSIQTELVLHKICVQNIEDLNIYVCSCFIEFIKRVGEKR